LHPACVNYANRLAQAVKYKSSLDAAQKIMAAEGVRSFFKGAGANILRGVAGAGVLSIYDREFSPSQWDAFND
jgi:hypothetical protein